ncbi:hypothetical protein NHX12_008195 [Muraenolepis orangiensis]|uniref:Uncharacterized protein n=1 Tax=Muraenolepis orangiensis TaxID=630683 RepID=A0A9Q0DL00_9TELE|nr:hypothetical protein NHX12_008195 [Muraenolepis orangiensis]
MEVPPRSPDGSMASTASESCPGMEQRSSGRLGAISILTSSREKRGEVLVEESRDKHHLAYSGGGLYIQALDEVGQLQALGSQQALTAQSLELGPPQPSSPRPSLNLSSELQYDV